MVGRLTENKVNFPIIIYEERNAEKNEMPDAQLAVTQ